MASRLVAVCALLAFSVPSVASAQEPPPDPPQEPSIEPLPAPAAPPEPLPPTVTPPADTAAAASSDDAAFAKRTLRLFADDSRIVRLGTGAGLVLTGASSIAAGIIADGSYHEPYGQVLWIGGLAVLTSGVVSFFSKTPMEAFARDASALSPRELEVRWAIAAERARTARKASGLASVILGAAAAGAGAALAAGAGNLENDSKQAWAVALIGVGGAFLGTGVTSFLVESPLERGYRVAYGVDASPADVSLSISPTLGGGAATLLTRF